MTKEVKKIISALEKQHKIALKNLKEKEKLTRKNLKAYDMEFQARAILVGCQTMLYIAKKAAGIDLTNF